MDLKYSALTLPLLLIATVIQNATSNDRLNIRGMGMARTSVVASRGLDAVGVNPANLGLSENDLITITVLPIGAFLESDFLTYDLYSKYLKVGQPLRDLPVADKDAILKSFQNPLGESRAEAAMRLFGVTVRVDPASSIAFNIDYSLLGAATIPREYIRLLLNGSVPNSTFDISQLSLNAYWTRSYTFSYGTVLPILSLLRWFSIGASVKLLQGYGFYEIQHFNASLQTQADGSLSGPVEWQARWTSTNSITHPLSDLFQDPAGYGLGMDLGISVGLDDNITFGLSVTDLGWITWTRDVESIVSSQNVAGASPESFKNVTSFEEVFGLRKRNREPFKQSLSSTVRVGISAHLDRTSVTNFPGELTLATEYLQAIGDESALKEKPRLSFGMEYKPTHWLPIRTGLSLGTTSTTHVSFGLGFHLQSLHIDLATEDIIWFFDQRRFSTGSVGLGFKFVIPR